MLGARNLDFFYLDLTGFATPEETEELGRLAREFSALPSEEKNKIHLGLQDNARGTYMDLYSALQNDRPVFEKIG